MARGPCCIVTVLFLTLACVVSSVFARTWTDRDGRSVDGKFVRVVGGVAVIRAANGKIVQIPVAQLCSDDQAYLRSRFAEKGVRVWTDTLGNQIEAQFQRLENGRVIVECNGVTSSLPFLGLSVADRDWVRTKAAQTGRDNELPERGEEEQLPETRTWTDRNGNTMEGQLDRVLPNRRVLLSVKQATCVVRIENLSPEDHDYLREVLEPKGLTHLVPAKPAPRPDTTVIVSSTPAPGYSPPSTVTPPRSSGTSRLGGPSAGNAQYGGYSSRAAQHGAHSSQPPQHGSYSSRSSQHSSYSPPQGNRGDGGTFNPFPELLRERRCPKCGKPIYTSSGPCFGCRTTAQPNGGDPFKAFARGTAAIAPFLGIVAFLLGRMMRNS